MENAKIHVMGCAAVVVSGIKLEDWKLAEKYAPEELVILDETGEPVFKVCTDDGPGCLVDDRAVLGSKTAKDGYATITVLVDPDVEDVMKAVMDTLGTGLMHLTEVENSIAESREEILKKRNDIEASIERL